MNTIKLLTSAVVALSVVGGVGLAVAQTGSETTPSMTQNDRSNMGNTQMSPQGNAATDSSNAQRSLDTTSPSGSPMGNSGTSSAPSDSQLAPQADRG